MNNAGMAPRIRADILEAGEESFDELLGANLKGPYFLTQTIARAMLARTWTHNLHLLHFRFHRFHESGRLLHLESGVSMAAKLFAARLAPHGIGVFEIQPGIIRTDMIAKVAASYDEKIANGLLPQRRMGEPVDIARTIGAIADGLLDYCAGQTLHADGGFHLRTL